MKEVAVNHRKGERPMIELTVRRVEPRVWRTLQFDKYHYLTADLNKSCKCLLFEWDGVPIGFVGILNTPRKGIPYGCSLSRMVILPDFEGLGLSRKRLDFYGGLVKSMCDDGHDYGLIVKTAHGRFGESSGWNPYVRETTCDGTGWNMR